ncbi:MAG TPA: GGDEF domain-containing protein [Rheinheimera sp.]|nr:GGDEF domain-containing protein [Rheinheimera sp.]
MTMLLAALAIASITGLFALTVFTVRQNKRLKAEVAELENQLRSHSFELQITLEELTEKNQLLTQQTQLDALSGIYNRAYFDNQMRAEIKRSRREQRQLALVLLDIDHFKQINDTYGHLTGDKAIKHTAAVIQKQLKRPGDKVCRYGGEEFALILPNTDVNGAQLLAEKIRRALAELSAMPLQLTLSAGCYSAVPQTQSDADEYIGFADKALYRAKASGRNQVCSFPPSVAPPLVVTGEIHEH